MSSRCLKDHVRIAARRQKEGEHKGQGQIAVSAVGGSGDGDRLTAPLLIIAGFATIQSHRHADLPDSARR
jgi:hypothetical protein